MGDPTIGSFFVENLVADLGAVLIETQLYTFAHNCDGRE